MCKFLGYSEEELLARTVLDVTHPDDRDESRELGQRLSPESQMFSTWKSATSVKTEMSSGAGDSQRHPRCVRPAAAQHSRDPGVRCLQTGRAYLHHGCVRSGRPDASRMTLTVTRAQTTFLSLRT